MIYCTCGHLLVESESSPNFKPMATGCPFNHALRHQEGATPWCSARQNRSTERAFCGPQRAEEIVSKRIMMEFTIVSSHLKIGWTEEKCIALDKLAQEDHSYNLIQRGIFEMSKTLVSHTEQIGPRFALLIVSPIFHFFFLFHVDDLGVRSPVHFAQ